MSLAEPRTSAHGGGRAGPQLKLVHLSGRPGDRQQIPPQTSASGGACWLQTRGGGGHCKLLTAPRGGREGGREGSQEAALFIASKQTNCFALRSQKGKKKKKEREYVSAGYWKSGRHHLGQPRGEGEEPGTQGPEPAFRGPSDSWAPGPGMRWAQGHAVCDSPRLLPGAQDASPVSQGKA